MAQTARRTEGPPAVSIDISIEAGQWPSEPGLTTSSERAIAAAERYVVAQCGQGMPEFCELSLLFTNDAAMRAVNRQWRGKDSPTNVLSFPAAALRPGQTPGPMLGDIVLSYETVAREAEASSISLSDHLAHLLVHGYLHLLGYDHVDPFDAETMESLEVRILATLGISDPYGDAELSGQ